MTDKIAIAPRRIAFVVEMDVFHYLGARQYTYKTGSFNPAVPFDRARVFGRHCDAAKLAERYGGRVRTVDISA